MWELGGWTMPMKYQQYSTNQGQGSWLTAQISYMRVQRQLASTLKHSPRTKATPPSRLKLESHPVVQSLSSSLKSYWRMLRPKETFYLSRTKAKSPERKLRGLRPLSFGLLGTLNVFGWWILIGFWFHISCFVELARSKPRAMDAIPVCSFGLILHSLFYLWHFRLWLKGNERCCSTNHITVRQRP